MEILAKRMRELRKERKLSQADTAKAIGVAWISYQRYESGERDPMAPSIAAFAEYFNVSADYLLGLSNDRWVYLGNHSLSRKSATVPLCSKGECHPPSKTDQN